MWGDDRECSIHPPRRQIPISVAPRGKSDQRGIIEPGQTLLKGCDSVELSDFKIDGLPSGEAAVFTINL